MFKTISIQSSMLLVSSYLLGNVIVLISCKSRHSYNSPYRIVVDGGSTGSRLHIFEFQKEPATNNTQCIRLGSHKSKLPLSSFARTTEQIQDQSNLNATHVAQHLIPSFQYAAKIIPEYYHGSTSVHYQATAGMRLIAQEEQEIVYDAMYEGLIHSPDFVFDRLERRNIATLVGEEEALYGAVAANYLKGVVDVRLHMIQKDGTVEEEEVEFDGPLGALDMGGASMQIVYLPHEEFFEDEESAGDHDQDEIDVDDEGHQESIEDDIVELPNLPNRLNEDAFFSTSYLSYGADQFRERLWNTWVSERTPDDAVGDDGANNVTNIILNPCSFKGYKSEWKGCTLVGTGDAQQCSDEVNRLIPHHVDPTETALESRKVGGVEHPPIRGHFFAMSLFFFTLDCLRELSQLENLNESWPTPSISDLTDALDILCSRRWHGDLEQIQDDAHEFTRAEVLPDRCFESVYMVTLLRDGFGFELDSKDITFTFLVDGSEVDWSLGMAVSDFAEDHVHAVSVRKPEVEIEGVQDDGSTIGKLFWSAHDTLWKNAAYLSKRFQAASNAMYA